MKVVTQRILAGFLGRNEVMAQANSLAAMSSAIEKKKFWGDFEKAHAHRAQMAVAPLPTPVIKPLDPSAKAHLDAVEATNAFQDAYGGIPYQFAEVNLDALQPVQIFMNVQPRLVPPTATDAKALLAYCLPPDPAIPADVRLTPNGAQFSTDRYGHGVQNIRRRIVGGQVHVSFEHPNMLQVVQFEGVVGPANLAINRLLISNGNHRAFELLAAGHKTAPALVIKTTNPAELQPWCPQGQGFWTIDCLLAAGTPLLSLPFVPRPALLGDFLTPLAIEYPAVLIPSVVDITIGSPPPSSPPQQGFAIKLKPQ